MGSIGSRCPGKLDQRKPGELLNQPAEMGANGGATRSLTFRDRMQGEATKAAVAETADPWRLVLERLRG